ncbi:lipopolysaccharide biosynthesis protein [Salinibacter ruber]|uniref:lipopolysaccharide biosynthesis protein n=1 Tax=Salinibacter ruber TaxID=146919 RepID=UPI00207374CD|nr:oligosaccharide flippase family protein [Salinibacter ruber]
MPFQSPHSKVREMANRENDVNGAGSFAFIRDIGLASIVPFVKKIKGVALIPIITKWIGAEGFGVWKQFSVTSGFIAILATVGTAQVIHRYLAPMDRSEKYSAHFFAIGLLVSCVALLCAIGLVTAPQFASARIFGPDTSLHPLYLLAAYLPVLAFSNRLLTFLRSRRRFDVVAPLMVVRDLGSLLLVATLILLGKGVTFAVGGFVLWEAFGMLVTLELARRTANLKLTAPDFSGLQKYLSFGLPLALVTVGARLAKFADRYVIVNWLGVEQVGIYSVAYTGGAVGVLFLKPINQVLLPDFSVLIESGMREKIEQRLGSIVKYFIASQAAILVFAFFLGHSALLLVSTESFLQGIQVLKVIPVAIMAYGLLQIGTQVLNAEESTRAVGAIWLGTGIVNVLANIIAVPVLGMLGAGLATLLCYALGAGVCWWVVLRMYSPKVKYESLFKVGAAMGIASSAMGLFSYYETLPPLLTLLVGGVIGGMVYSSALIGMGFVNRQEERLLRRNLNNKLVVFLVRVGVLRSQV